MATTDLKTFLEDRLRALDPTIDLDSGSPAQVQFIEPVMTYLGTDPFETDIDSFITDRFAQEFPELIATDPGVIRDTFVKPLILLLTPFQRETQSIKRNQSLKDPSVLSDEDADALVANVFDERDAGSFSTGTGRLYFSNPTNIQVEITTRFFTASGLGFFPTNPVSITAEEMAFNRSGSQYFFDVALKAESEGVDYNIDVNQLTGVDGLFGVIRVGNLQKFRNGSARVDTTTFVAQARQALNERSLNTRRGATARLNDVFQTELRAVQVIGSEDPEMQRDILVATSPGHQWITGRVTIWKKLALVQARTIEGPEAEAPKAGDVLYLYLDTATYPALLQTTRLVRLTVEEVLVGPVPSGTTFQMTYLVRFSGDFPSGVVVTDGSGFEGGFTRPGTVQISSLPSVGQTNFSVPSGEVHVYGHTDFYIRPILQPASTSVFDGLSDSGSLVERLTLQTFGLTTEKNKIADPGSPTIDFQAAGVLPGDLLSVETGDDIGVYVIMKVTASNLYLTSNLANSQSNLRYRIIRKIKVDPFEPKIPKFPFGGILANDLQTVIGSNLFQLLSNDVIGFGAAVGDVLRVKTGILAGDYTITGFDPVLGGQGLLLDRPASASLTGLEYEIFSALDPVERPLVRIKELLLLDSSSQSTGIQIPLADPVGVVPTKAFTSARVRGGSQRVSGFVLPSMTSSLTAYLALGPVAAPSGDRRYSLGFDTAIGWYFPMLFADGTYSELDFHGDGSGNGDAYDPASYFVSVSEVSDDAENFPPIDPRPGECLTIKDGPNKGSYLIKEVVKFKHRLASPTRTVWTYFIKIYGKFPVDVYGQLFDFLNDIGGGASVTEFPITASISYPSFFQNLHNSLGTKLNSALTTLGVTAVPSAPTLQAAIDSLTFCDYEWGDPARGVLRTFMMSPTVLEQRTGDSESTEFVYKTESGELVKFRPDPNRYRQQEIVPPRLVSDTDPKDLPRDLDLSGSLNYSTQTANFTVGKKVTGATSGATATILNDLDLGLTGTLGLSNVEGEFVVGEIITDDNGAPGSATVSGALTQGLIVSFTDPGRVSIFSLGVRDGDILSTHEEVFFHGTTYARQSVIQTVAGSNQVTAPTSAGNIFNADMVGNLFFVEEGTDKGSYRVVKYVDGRNLILDQAMTESTPTVLLQGNLNQWGHNGTNNVLISTGTDFTPYVNKYISVFGIPYPFQGSYQITSAPSLGTAVISRTTNFPGSPTLKTESDANFLVTEAPATAPTPVLKGTEIYAARPFRMYESVVKEHALSSVVYTDLSISRASIPLGAVLRKGLNQPFRIYRKDVRRVTPSEMELNTFGPTVFFDTEVVSLNPQESSNLSDGSYLETVPATFSSVGYKHKVDDSTLTYSMQEEGIIEISPQILPTGSTDSAENFLNLLGSSIQVTYEQSDLVRRIQEFANSGQDRISSANILVRHFLPTYVSYDATYVGGSAPSVVASDIITYLDNLPIETAVDVSEIQDIIAKRGGNPVTPTSVVTILHDWGRRVWLEFSSNQLGGIETQVPYDGTARVSYFIPGPDVSGQDPLPSGERINLVRQ